MKRLAGVLCCTALAACTGSKPPAPPGPERALAPAPQPSACAAVASLAATGEHKPAVDQWPSLRYASVACNDAVLAAVERSRAALDEADAYVHRALQSKKEDDLDAARRHFDTALAICPKYYWARKLRDDLDQIIVGDVANLKSRGRARQAAGDPPGAIELLEKAAALAPGDAETAAELADLRRQLAERQLRLARSAEQRGDLTEADRRITLALEARPDNVGLRNELIAYARLLGVKFFSDGQLTLAKELWQSALSLDDANPQLLDYLHQVEERLESLTRIKPDAGG